MDIGAVECRLRSSIRRPVPGNWAQPVCGKRGTSILMVEAYLSRAWVLRHMAAPCWRRGSPSFLGDGPASRQRQRTAVIMRSAAKRSVVHRW